MEQAVNTKTSVQTFEELLAASVAAHGHLCPGQIVGVRLAMLGCRLIGFDVPCPYHQLKQLIVFIEMDRCTGDAVAHVTGVKLGRRSLKFADYGIMAATFINLETQQAYRVISTEEARDLAPLYSGPGLDKRGQQLEAYRAMPDSVLFRVQKVKVKLSPFDLPGPTGAKSLAPNAARWSGITGRSSRMAGRSAAPAPAGPTSRPPGRLSGMP